MTDVYLRLYLYVGPHDSFALTTITVSLIFIIIYTYTLHN